MSRERDKIAIGDSIGTSRETKATLCSCFGAVPEGEGVSLLFFIAPCTLMLF